MPKATLVAPARPGGCQKSPELTTGTAWPLSPPQLMGDDVELRVPPPPLLWAESLGGEEAGRKGLGEASHHQGGSRPESVWLPTETRHEVMAKMNLNLAGGGGLGAMAPVRWDGPAAAGWPGWRGRD